MNKMNFRTIVDIPKPGFEIQPCEKMLFVGSCFANEIGQRFQENGFPVAVNPYGTMYNPASVLHTVERYFADPNLTGGQALCEENRTWGLSPCEVPQTVFLTLGTNHVYRLKESGEIVDNCEKRPQNLFQEEQLSIEACVTYLQKTVDVLRQRNPDVRVVLTVSPIRYRKYGYHESQLSKAILLLAIDRLQADSCYYFPAYEILTDELRDYRFYAPDMLHPSQQAVDYVWERLVDSCFSAAAKTFLDEWRPLKQILAHRPFNPDSEDYKALMQKTMQQVDDLRKKYKPVNVLMR